MRTRIISVAAVAVLILNTFAFAAIDTKAVRSKKAAAARLVAALPASDAIAVFDAKRFLSDSLPKVLTANKSLLSKMLGKVTDIESRTGIDLKKFDQAAIGVSFKEISPTVIDLETVVIANGDLNADALLDAAKLAAKGNVRTETIGGRPVHITTIQMPPADTIPASNDILDLAMKNIAKELAVTALDATTIAMGSVNSVRAVLEGSSKVDPIVNSLLPVKGSAIIAFASRMPAGVSSLLPVELDSMDSSVQSIKFLSGTFDITAAGASVKTIARTATVDEALQLQDTLVVLRQLGGGFMSSSKRADQKMYGRLLNAIKIDAKGTDVSLELLVPQTDINVLVAKIK